MTLRDSAYKDALQLSALLLPAMSPVSTNENASAPAAEVKNVKENVFNPFYSPSIGDDGDKTYQWAKYKVFLDP